MRIKIELNNCGNLKESYYANFADSVCHTQQLHVDGSIRRYTATT